MSNAEGTSALLKLAANLDAFQNHQTRVGSPWPHTQQGKVAEAGNPYERRYMGLGRFITIPTLGTCVISAAFCSGKANPDLGLGDALATYFHMRDKIDSPYILAGMALFRFGEGPDDGVCVSAYPGRLQEGCSPRKRAEALAQPLGPWVVGSMQDALRWSEQFRTRRMSLTHAKAPGNGQSQIAQAGLEFLHPTAGEVRPLVAFFEHGNNHPLFTRPAVEEHLCEIATIRELTGSQATLNLTSLLPH